MEIRKSTTDSGQALLVSADAANADVVRRAMRGEGFEILECSGADAGLKLLLNSVPAFIVIDSELSDGEPIALCRTIRENRKCRFVPVILTTADEDRAALHRAYDAGFTTVLDKPLVTESLRQRFQSFGDTGRTLTGLQVAPTGGTSSLLHVVPDAFFEVNAKGVVNKHLGGGDKDPLLRPAELQGKSFRDSWPQAVAERVMRNIRRTLTTRDGYDFDFELSDETNCSRYEMRLLVQGRDRVLAIVRNITASAGADARRGRSPADTLTGLATRDIFCSQLETLVADARLRERGLALMCIGIDRFGRINESLGRKVGDTVLGVTAKRIQRCLRDADRVAQLEEEGDSGELARIRGDEFVLVLTDVKSRDEIGQIADRIQEAFKEPVSYEDRSIAVSLSIGVALFPVDGADAETLLENAGAALTEARTHGRNGRSFYSDTMRFRSLQRFDVIDELRWAIEKEQLELHYLPRIDLDSGRVSGLEALLRWMHPLRGNVPMTEVLPLAEATGLMLPIGEWIVANACGHAAAWLEQDRGAPNVSVNLSQDEFARDDLVEVIGKALADSSLPAERLQLELTEAMLMRHDRAASVLSRLKKIGVQLAIDDFGTGHSSFAHLRALPIDAVKIDRSFVVGVEQAGDGQAICGAIIAMAHELGLGVIAVGVETKEQLEFLRERGCGAAQGFFYTEPLPADQVSEFLEGHAAGESPMLSVVSSD